MTNTWCLPPPVARQALFSSRGQAKAPSPVDLTTAPATAWGVKVSVGTCQSAAFGAVVGHSLYTQWVDAQAGPVAQGPMPTPTNTPTNTPVVASTLTSTPTPMPTSTATPSIADFVFYAPSDATAVPVIYSKDSQGYPAGDTVTLFGNGGGWAGGQYNNQDEGKSGTPTGLPKKTIHDSSFEGCLNPDDPTVTVGGYAAFNHGGVGHCADAPTVGQTYAIPIIDQAYKNEDPPCGQNGGYCVHVIGIAWVKITVSNIPGLVQGIVVGVAGPGDDPHGVIALPVPPTPTPTSTVTPTPTSTATPIITPTPTATSVPKIGGY